MEPSREHWWRAARDWFIAEGSGEPHSLVGELATAPFRSVVTGLLLGRLACASRVEAGDVAAKTFLPGRGLGDTAEVEYLRLSYAQAAALLAGPAAPVDGLLVQVAPTARRGVVSLGVQSALAEAAISGGARVVAQVNPRMPAVAGAPVVPLERLAHHAELAEDLRDVPRRHPSPAERAIAASVAELVPDGAAIEIGIGAVPDAVYAALTGHRGIRIRSGMASDGVRTLLESGALDDDPADGAPSVTATMLLGSASFYRWAAAQSRVGIRPVAWTHDRDRLCATEGFVAVNSAIEVDLSGNVNAEYAGGRYVSGMGGLPDFAEAAVASPGGMSIIALPSMARSGRSRISRTLQSPAATVPASHVTHVVTEWGVAVLSDDAEQRASALTAVAHPSHRNALGA